MKALRYLFTLLLAACLQQANAQKDSLHYMFSYVGINIGYGVNTIPTSTQTVVYPFYGKSGPALSASALLAIKESYFGIAISMGYTAPQFDATAYGKATLDTNRWYTYTSGSAGSYQIYYLMAGIDLKIPEHTTREAIELRFMVGPLIATRPAVQYTYTYYNPYSSTTPVYQGATVNAATRAVLAFSPGISGGYKLSHRIALMANADLLFADPVFKISEVLYTTGSGTTVNNPPQNIIEHSSMVYLHLTAGLVYTFGKMTPNIAY